MLGLFGTLNLSARSLQVQQQGIEVAGHNMANVNNTAYARQRLSIETSSAIETQGGLQGTGADVARILQVRDTLLDAQLVGEESFTGSLEAQQLALQYAQSDLGQQIDRQATGAEGAAAAAGTGTQHSIGDSITDLLNSFKRLSLQPTSDTERGLVIKSAEQLATRFQQTDSRLAGLRASLNTSVEEDVADVNSTLEQIARLNDQITRAEVGNAGIANDLRDSRQARLEELGKLVKFDAVPGEHSAINIAIGGVTMVDGVTVTETLETYDVAGATMVRAASTDAPLTITSGHINGLITARDGTIQTLRDDLSALANSLITEINRIHQTGFGLDDSTGLAFFEGTSAADIRVSATLKSNPKAIATSDTVGKAGNNGIIVALGQLAEAPQAAFNSQTFSQRYGRIVADLGAGLSSINEQITDQNVVSNMLKSQRDSISAVSLDEEMSDLIKYQRAYQASAQVVNAVNEMLETIITMAR